MKLKRLPTQRGACEQKGMTLIVVLVILVAMTFLGLGSMSDSNIQVALVRNTQFQNMAFSAAQSEINGQFDVVNNPVVPGVVPSIIRAVQLYDNDTGIGLPVTLDDAQMPAVLPDILGADLVENNLEQDLSFQQIDITPLGSLNGSPIASRNFSYTSVVTIENTNFSSSQTQGGSYVSASLQN